MPSEQIKNAVRVVVLIEQADGTQRAWDVANISQLDWVMSGTDEIGTRGRVTVEGSFYRKRTGMYLEMKDRIDVRAQLAEGNS